MEKIRSLQILRFIAAALVVQTHALLYTGRIAGGLGLLGAGALHKIGPFGVDVFFVISGFVITITGPLAVKRPTGIGFFWLRWSRVAPFFWLMSAPWVILSAEAGLLNWNQTAATFLFWPMLSGKAVTPYLFVGWTLCFEMLFYTAVSLALAGGNLSRNIKIGGVALMALLVARACGWPPARILANPIFCEFAFGGALALARPWLRRQDPKAGVLIIGSSIGLLALASAWAAPTVWDLKPVIYDTGSLYRVAVLGVPAALLVAGALICEPWAKKPWTEVFVRLGDSSYALYLVHPFAFMLMGVFWVGLPLKPVADVMTVTSIAICIAAGWAVHCYVERPIIRDLRALGKTVSARQRSRAATA